MSIIGEILAKCFAIGIAGTGAFSLGAIGTVAVTALSAHLMRSASDLPLEQPEPFEQARFVTAAVPAPQQIEPVAASNSSVEEPALFSPVLAYPIQIASAGAAEPVDAAAPEPVSQPAPPTAAAKPNSPTPATPARGVSNRPGSSARKAQEVKVASLGNTNSTGPPMRMFPAGWKPINTAPLDQDVTLLVTDGRGEPYPIPYPCKRTAAGWVSLEGTPLVVTPLRWKPYVGRPKK
jgi:hypothetical protein